jgi:pimeloyl-ACP methyl ester carboxylesterase
LTEDPGVNRFIRIVATPFFRFLVVNFNLLLRYTVSGLDRKSKSRLAKAEQRAYLMPFADRRRRRHQHDLFRSITNSQDYLLDLKNRLPELRHFPVLLAFADGDPTYQAGWLQRYEGIFPDHTSVRIEGSHHFPHEYDPEAMVRAIRDWWERKWSDANQWAITTHERHQDKHLATFQQHRPLLVLPRLPHDGQRSEAEDILQDAYLRFRL